MSLRITNIQRGCVYDGPGIRTTIFLKGCTMHCPWCCNPETIKSEQQYFVEDDKCLYLKGTESVICKDCVRTGGAKLEKECPFGVKTPVSQGYTCEELYHQLEVDFTLMQSSNGGITFSGGEPLLQIDEIEQLLSYIKDEGINIAFETTLFSNTESLQKALLYADIMIIDIKLQPQHPLYKSSSYIQKLSAHIKICRSNHKPVVFRMVFTDDMMGDVSYIVDSLRLLNIDSIELLKCHNLGAKKYQMLKIANDDYSASYECMYQFSQVLSNNDIQVSLLMV